MKRLVFVFALTLMATSVLASPDISCTGADSTLQGPEFVVQTDNSVTISFLKSCAEAQQKAKNLGEDYEVTVAIESDGTYTLKGTKE